MTAVRSFSSRQDEALFKRTSCGQVAINLAGEIAILRQSGALWLTESRTLVVADLHLEKGSAYARTGQLLPPFDSAHSLSRLGAEAADLAPDEILLLGIPSMTRTESDGSAQRVASALKRSPPIIG